MHGFIANQTNKLDAKGRVSIPASFRQVLVRDGFEGLYCFPSRFARTVDAGGNTLLNTLTSKVDTLEPMTPEHDELSLMLFGDSEVLKVDSEGRISITEKIREATGITNTVAFVGLNYKFQLWDPEEYRLFKNEAGARGAREARA